MQQRLCWQLQQWKLFLKAFFNNSSSMMLCKHLKKVFNFQ